MEILRLIKFDALRITLAVPPKGPLFPETEVSEPKVSRTDFLRAIFSQQTDFFYRGKLFTYVPSPVHRKDDKVLSGFVGKQLTVEENQGPETLFAKIEAKKWRAAFLAVDTSDDEQLLYFQRRPDVGSAERIASQLFSERRKDFSFSWDVHIHHLQEERDFWVAASQNQGNLTEIEFILYPPNVLRGFDKIKKLQEEINKDVNGDEGSLAFRNADGNLNVDNEFVKDAVKYTTNGGGAAVLKSGRKKVFDSRRTKKIKEVPEEIMPEHAEQSKILGLIDYLFGRKNGKD
jgi:hypothetical protein